MIDIRGMKWKWTATYDNGANPPDLENVGYSNGNIPVMYVPVGRPVLFRMTSNDVLHSFWIPDFRYKFDVIPNRYTNYWINAEEPGEHWIFCAEYCGDYHSEMSARLIALPADEYDAGWDVSGTLQDLALYYDVGLGLANSSRWPNWRVGTEFRALRDASR